MRVCILTKAEPYAWTRHYVLAFRECGHDVLTVGPNITRDELAAMHLGHLFDTFVPNDIETRLDSDILLAEVLPAGWLPDLIVAISIGGAPLCPTMEKLRCPTVYISIDTWQSPRDYLDAIAYDFVFVAQREYAPRMEVLGSRNVTWLPLACSPSVHYPSPQPVLADISFVGSIVLPIHQERYELLQRLQAEFHMLAQSCMYGPMLCRMCGSTKLTFNHSAVRDLNMRVFEAPAMGVPLLTNRDSAANGLLDLFEDGTHLIVYDSPDDLMAKARKYLHDDDARKRIADAGLQAVLAKHTYRHRAEAIVDTVARHVPQLGHGWPPKCQTHDIVNQLPAGPESVLDFGMRLGAASDDLRQRGVRRLIALTRTEPAQPVDAYGQVLVWDAALQAPQNVDVAVVDDLRALPASIDQCLHAAHAALRSGGTLLLRLRAEELAAFRIPLDAEAMRVWLLRWDFLFQRAVLGLNATSGAFESCIISARKRTRKLRDVVDDTFTNLTANCVSVHESICQWCANFPSGI